MSPDTSPIGIYVHHHGSGHATRAKLLSQHWPTAAPFHIFTSAPDHFADWPAEQLHALPMDTDPGRDADRDHLTGQILHYAPLHCTGVSARMLAISRWIHEQKPALFIVDLSVEVALFARLCGAPVALMRLHGFRSDPAHEAAFRLADVLLAPFPSRVEDAHTPDWVSEKTIYLGAFSRYDERKESRDECRQQLGYKATDKLITIVNGSGGGHRSSRYWSRVAQANPDRIFVLVGKLAGQDQAPANLHRIGYVADTFPYLKAADIVIGSGGTNTMHEIAAAGARFLSIPEQRPYSEQYCKMKALQGQGLTRMVSADIKPEEWGKWFFRAGDLIPDRWLLMRREDAISRALQTLQSQLPKRPVVKPIANASGKRVGTPVLRNFQFGG